MENHAEARKSAIEHVKKQIPVCSNCINRKIILWKNQKSAKYTDQYTGEISSGTDVYTFVVRCAFIKQMLIRPAEVVACEAWKGEYDGE